jgi:serine O-acetyltransferase
MMEIETGEAGLLALLKRQLGALFAFDAARETAALEAGARQGLARAEKCFAAMTGKYFRREGKVYFNPFHSGQYTVFLYFVSHAVWRGGAPLLADRVYYLNKALNGLDLFYEVEMPDIFFTDHPVGSVIGRGRFGDGFSFTQNCTVGNNKGVYPTFGRNVSLMSGAKVIGDTQVGDNVIFAANTYVKDARIPSNSLVFGSSPDLVIKARDAAYFERK